MEDRKICIGVDWKYSGELDSLTILKNIIQTYKYTKIDYFAISLLDSNLLNPSIYDEIDNLCREQGANWFPIVSSINEINLTRPYYSTLPNGKIGYMLAIPSSCIKDFKILNYARECSDYLILYTNSCTQKEIDRAIEAAQPDMIIHYSQKEPRLNYIKYLNGISIDFDKKYQIGFKNEFLKSSVLMTTAYLFGATFLEHTIEVNEQSASFYLDLGTSDTVDSLLYDLSIIDESREGYEARKLTAFEKEIKKG
jgi:hypothetical protein